MLGGIYAFIKMQQGDVTPQWPDDDDHDARRCWLYGPKYWVTRRQAARQEAITNGFPDSLDMMLVCVEAGQSLDQSIIRVARELKSGFPDLSHEFEVVSQEMKAGKDKDKRSEGHGRARWRARHQKLCHRVGPVAAIWYVHRRCVAGLCRRKCVTNVSCVPKKRQTNCQQR